MNKSHLLTLTPLGVVRMVESNKHFLKVQGGVGDNAHMAWVPVSILTKEVALKGFIADHFAYIAEKNDPTLLALCTAVASVPRFLGTSRLGWTPERDAFIYGGTVCYMASEPTQRYEFIAPEGTLLKRAEEALQPKGSREAQYQAFRELWDGSVHFRLVLSLAAASPFLEIINAPSLVFHLAGLSGSGKTTALRLGLSVYANPDSPLTRIDFSKDTQNYADAQLGILHNFPILLDETTLHDPRQLAGAAYNIALGRTKGRLTGPEQNYLPAEPLPYTLVCFLSGEVSIRDTMDQRGAVARFVEIVVEEPILAKKDLAKWWDFAETHYGWFGQDLITAVIKQYFAQGQRGQKLQAMYAEYRAQAAVWCLAHARMLDTLAVIQLGHYLASKLLHHGFKYLPHSTYSSLLLEAEKFAQELYERLNKTTRLDQVLEAICEQEGMQAWVERGFIPLRDLMSVAAEFEMVKPSQLGELLRRQGVVSKIESRKIEGGGGSRVSARSCILTTYGKELLGKRRQTPA
jgi:hypothetical protein